MGTPALKLGDIRGGFEVVGYARGAEDRRRIYRMRCMGCGKVSEMTSQRSRRRRSCGCIQFDQPKMAEKTKRYHIDWNADYCPEVERFIRDHPDGALLDEIGAEMGLSRERVRQILEQAISRLRGAMACTEWAEHIHHEPLQEDRSVWPEPSCL